MTDTPTPPPQYQDTDVVYVDPESRMVIGKIQWTKGDKPKSLPYVAMPTAKDKKDAPRRFFRKFYPFGTYRSMKHAFKIDGARKEEQPERTLDDVLPKALEQAFWNN